MSSAQIPAGLKLPKEDAFVFCPKPSSFTPLYEGEGASYDVPFGSVNAGAFQLYVGGGAINAGFARTLGAAGHDVDAYEDLHGNFHDQVVAPENQDRFKGEKEFKLVDWLDVNPPTSPSTEAPRLPTGVKACFFLPSTLDDRFRRSAVLAGSVFIDVFEEDLRPLNNKNNVAMVYVVGPEGSMVEAKTDFLDACVYTGANLARAVTEYNERSEERLQQVRMCLVSGGLFRHEEASKEEVAAAFLRGISQEVVEDKTPKFEFAYDEDVFKLAYSSLAQAADAADAPPPPADA